MTAALMGPGRHYLDFCDTKQSSTLLLSAASSAAAANRYKRMWLRMFPPAFPVFRKAAIPCLHALIASELRLFSLLFLGRRTYPVSNRGHRVTISHVNNKGFPYSTYTSYPYDAYYRGKNEGRKKKHFLRIRAFIHLPPPFNLV